ncbi:MAG: VWA domain-containing protein [Candidatus Krumholzibacteria bacterium]|nr:VWA domain-containing protein [Candidatus Krumholzibacteria bacterium]
MHFELWKILVAAALIVFALFAYRGTYPPISFRRRTLLAGMRTGAFVLLGLLLVNPTLVSTKVEVRKPLVLLLLDHSRSMGIRDSAGRTRLDAALSGMDAFRRSLGGEKADVEVLPFAESISSLPLRGDSSVEADGEGTDVWGALEAAQRRYRSRNLAAMILLSDGRITRGMVVSSEKVTTPVYTIGFGCTLARADVSITDVSADRVAYRGTNVPVEAVIRASGFRGRTIDVRLVEGKRIEDAASVSVKRDEEIISVPLSYEADAEGEHRLSVEASPLAGEEREDNNLETFRIDVLKDKVRILYIDQFPDWNMTFVRDLVKRSKRLDIEPVSWIADKGFAVIPGGKPWTFPALAAGLVSYDLIIVSDDARLFDARQNVEALDAFVKAGGSVLFLADESSPLTREGSFEILASLLPVRRLRNLRVDYTDVEVRLSAQAFNDPVASMLAEGGLDAMPPLSGRIVGIEAGSGARIPLVMEGRGGSMPFLALARRGEGLSCAVLGFPIWRWRLAGEGGQRIYESFLGGLVQYLAEGARAPALSVEADRTVYRSGDRVRLTVHIGERRAPDCLRGEVRERTGGRDRTVSSVIFEPDSRRKSCYRSELDPLPPGEYSVAVSEITGSVSGASGTASFSVAPVSVEFLDTSRDGAALSQIALATGGEYLEGPGLGFLAPRLRLEERRVERKDVRGIRGDILVLFGIVALLGAEWTLRKAWGLV